MYHQEFHLYMVGTQENGTPDGPMLPLVEPLFHAMDWSLTLHVCDSMWLPYMNYVLGGMVAVLTQA